MEQAPRSMAIAIRCLAEISLLLLTSWNRWPPVLNIGSTPRPKVPSCFGATVE